MMWGYGYEPGWVGWLMMGVSNILWIALLGLLVWAVIRWFERRLSASGPGGSGTPVRGPSALEILSQRYARGEIDTATFEQMRERLQTVDTQRMLHESRP
ncbi:hypothetical protein KDH_36630 [Dictyobacter sp. S3.2.2.5]|uniref:SHOCT domain-containing protein n=2 Tax=Dictyobacter halimunensis TaxID=3026934 RepID=A0ABQ6FRG3_9CHLR|nr:hypothetical protein KDH_36630 [Dictyobacter sp. S3.2.2.5]